MSEYTYHEIMGDECGECSAQINWATLAGVILMTLPVSERGNCYPVCNECWQTKVQRRMRISQDATDIVRVKQEIVRHANGSVPELSRGH